jgi:hypothetical protein
MNNATSAEIAAHGVPVHSAGRQALWSARCQRITRSANRGIESGEISLKAWLRLLGGRKQDGSIPSSEGC